MVGGYRRGGKVFNSFSPLPGFFNLLPVGIIVNYFFFYFFKILINFRLKTPDLILI